MDVPVDLLNDPLAGAPLTPEQHQAWELTRSELIIARERIANLEVRIQSLENQTHESGIVQTILTRPEFNREVARMLAFDERYGGVSSVVYFDIDNFADIQKKDGLTTTDKIIRTICDTLAHHIRSSDILGRLASDEFGLLLTRCDNDAAWSKGESLALMLVEELDKISECSLRPIINYGAYTFRDKENVATGLKQAASSVTQAERSVSAKLHATAHDHP